jgi:hypothetical protein
MRIKFWCEVLVEAVFGGLFLLALVLGVVGASFLLN